MLFKTLLEEGGYYYCNVPKEFMFENLENDKRFAFPNTASIKDLRIERPRVPNGVRDDTEEFTVYTGEKHLWWFEENEKQKHIFFSGNGYIIKEKGKTIETL